MIYFSHFFFGLLMAYFGLISPGMLNMTGLKIRITKGKKESVEFAAGASVTVFFQVSTAIFFATYFNENPEIIEYLKIAGVGVFFMLAIFFFALSRKELNPKTTTTSNNYFIRGMGLSLINRLAIPFYLGMSIYLVSIHKVILVQPYSLLFVLGATLGSFLLFLTYILFAKYIVNKVSFIAKNINSLLSLLFIVLAIITLFKLFK